MSDIRRIISAERMKAMRRKSTLFIPVAVAAAAALIFITSGFAAQRDWIGVASGFYLASNTGGWMVNLLVLLSIILTCFHISGEFALGTVKSSWVRPVSRKSWFTGKLITVSAAVLFLYLIAIAVIILMARVRFGFTDLTEKDYLIHSASSMWYRFVLVFLLTCWALLGVTAVSAVFAVIMNRPGTAISAVLGSAFIMAAASAFHQARPFLLSSSLFVPFEQMTAMSKGLPLPLEWSTLVWRTLIGAGTWIAVSATAGYMIVEKKEITF